MNNVSVQESQHGERGGNGLAVKFKSNSEARILFQQWNSLKENLVSLKLFTTQNTEKSLLEILLRQA